MYKVEHRPIKVDEYQELRKTTGWNMQSDDVVGKALESDLFSLCIFDNETLIGMGRIIGDGASYFYVQDIIVTPTYQGKGVGRMIMENVETYLTENAPIHSFIGLMAAKGVAAFYEQFGYQRRPDDRPGMYKTVTFI